MFNFVIIYAPKPYHDHTEFNNFASLVPYFLIYFPLIKMKGTQNQKTNTLSMITF